MASVLTTASKVLCGPVPSHGGKVAVASTAKLRVQDASDQQFHPVLVADSIEGKSISGCATPPASDASGPTAEPCLFVSKVPQVPPPGVTPPPPPNEPGVITAGMATKLTVNGGTPVMLDTLKGFTDGMVAKTTPLNLLTASAVQTKLNAV
jgi:hypothetical protein